MKFKEIKKLPIGTRITVTGYAIRKPSEIENNSWAERAEWFPETYKEIKVGYYVGYTERVVSSGRYDDYDPGYLKRTQTVHMIRVKLTPSQNEIVVFPEQILSVLEG